jgi:SAM-dependent methyltransferase
MGELKRTHKSGEEQPGTESSGASTSISGTFAIGVGRPADESNPADEQSKYEVPPEQRVEAWCECSAAYGVFADAVTGPFAQDAARLVKLHPGAQVLDVAAGTGAFTFAAMERGAQVLATDFSPLMLGALKRNCHSRGHHSVRTAVMDGMNLELEDDTFDVAASLFGLMFFSDHEKGLSELFRVIKPGGQAVVTTWALPARVEMMRLIGETAMRAEIAVSSETVPTWLELASEAELRRRFRAHGFCNAHVVCVTHVWVLERAELFADLLPLMTPSSVSLFGGMTNEEQLRFRQVLVDGFHERQGSGPYAVTSQGMIAVGTKPC